MEVPTEASFAEQLGQSLIRLGDTSCGHSGGGHDAGPSAGFSRLVGQPDERLSSWYFEKAKVSSSTAANDYLGNELNSYGFDDLSFDETFNIPSQIASSCEYNNKRIINCNNFGSVDSTSTPHSHTSESELPLLNEFGASSNYEGFNNFVPNGNDNNIINNNSFYVPHHTTNIHNQYSDWSVRQEENSVTPSSQYTSAENTYLPPEVRSRQKQVEDFQNSYPLPPQNPMFKHEPINNFNYNSNYSGNCNYMPQQNNESFVNFAQKYYVDNQWYDYSKAPASYSSGEVMQAEGNLSYQSRQLNLHSGKVFNNYPSPYENYVESSRAENKTYYYVNAFGSKPQQQFQQIFSLQEQQHQFEILKNNNNNNNNLNKKVGNKIIAKKKTKSKTNKELSKKKVESGLKSKDEIFQCMECNKTFNRICYLTQHKNSYHSGSKPFRCTTCGKGFYSDQTMTRHLNRHVNGKPYKCEFDGCQKEFNYKTDLRRHTYLHTGYKPHVCDVCNRGFIRKDHLIKHFKSHARQFITSDIPDSK